MTFFSKDNVKHFEVPGDDGKIDTLALLEAARGVVEMVCKYFISFVRFAVRCTRVQVFHYLITPCSLICNLIPVVSCHGTLLPIVCILCVYTFFQDITEKKGIAKFPF